MPSDVKAILMLEVPIIVLLGERTMNVAEVCALGPGVIIELPKGSEEELELLVNNKRVGAGSAVKVGENFGIKITYIGDVRERIAALGKDEAPKPGAAAPATDLSALADAMLSGQT
jgi:flagellar motor switch protein FliN/FliY